MRAARLDRPRMYAPAPARPRHDPDELEARRWLIPLMIVAAVLVIAMIAYMALRTPM